MFVTAVFVSGVTSKTTGLVRCRDRNETSTEFQVPYNVVWRVIVNVCILLLYLATILLCWLSKKNGGSRVGHRRAGHSRILKLGDTTARSACQPMSRTAARSTQTIYERLHSQIINLYLFTLPSHIHKKINTSSSVLFICI